MRNSKTLAVLLLAVTFCTATNASAPRQGNFGFIEEAGKWFSDAATIVHDKGLGALFITTADQILEETKLWATRTQDNFDLPQLQSGLGVGALYAAGSVFAYPLKNFFGIAYWAGQFDSKNVLSIIHPIFNVIFELYVQFSKSGDASFMFFNQGLEAFVAVVNVVFALGENQWTELGSTLLVAAERIAVLGKKYTLSIA